jgi:phenolic acid decarboxylase
LLADGVYKVSWDEPTGTKVSVANSSSQTPILPFFSEHGWPLTQPDRIPITVAARKVTSTAQRSQSNGALFLQRIRRSSIPDASSLP